jgi:glycosyltransferase involved in cell wall biosynthesis
MTGTGALSASANGAARRGQNEVPHRSRYDSAAGLIGTKGGEVANPTEYSPPGRPVLRTDEEMATEKEIRAEAAKAALGLEGRRVLTIFGFLARRKGYDLALQALARLPEDVTLLAAGGVHGADRTAPDQELKALAERLGVGERFRITGYLAEEQVPVVFGATDLLLAPFHEVSGSASLALGQAYACPILAADLPSLRESGAALFPAGDAPALAAAVRQLLAHSEERERLAAVSRAHAARHSYHALAERTAAIYREVLP